MHRHAPRSGWFAKAPVTGAKYFVLAACGLYAFANAVLVIQQWEFDDIGAYLGAAQRLQQSLPLYVSTTDTSELYWYAPWFAFAWVPLTQLPRLGVEVVWALVLLIATGLTLIHFRRSVAELCVALLLGAFLFRTAGWGNVQPLLVVALIRLLPTRGGPWAVGIAGSLKVLPLLFLGVYAWRRQWAEVMIGLGVAAVLWSPALLFGLGDYPTSRGLNVYDSTLLMALPAAIRSGRSAGRGPATRP